MNKHQAKIMLKAAGIKRIVLVTHAFHMPRAKAIAIFILGSQGIAFTPVTMPSKEPPETWLHIIRDISRAIFWLFTRRTGASLNPEL